jgi:hypothetical protein
MDAHERKTLIIYKHILDHRLADLLKSARIVLSTRGGQRADSSMKPFMAYPGGPAVEAILSAANNRALSARYGVPEIPPANARMLRDKLERLVERLAFMLQHRLDAPRFIASESRSLGRLIEAGYLPETSVAESFAEETEADRWANLARLSAVMETVAAPSQGWIASRKGPPKPASRREVVEEEEEDVFTSRLRFLLKNDHALYVRWIFLRDIIAYVGETEKTRLLWEFVTKRIEPAYAAKYSPLDLKETDRLVAALLSMARWEDEASLPVRPMESAPGRAEIGDDVAIFRVTPTKYGVALYDPPGGKGEMMGERDLGQRESLKFAMEIAREYGRKVVYVTRKSRRRRIT